MLGFTVRHQHDDGKMDAEKSTESENCQRAPKGVATAGEAEARRGENAPRAVACESTRERGSGLAGSTGSGGYTDKLADKFADEPAG